MLIRILISILFIFLSGYLLFQVRSNFVSGMNPYLAGMGIIIGIVLLLSTYTIVARISNKAIRTSLQGGIVFVIIGAVLFFFFQQPERSNKTTPRRYIDKSGVY